MMKFNIRTIRFSTFLLLAFSVFLVGCEDDINDVNYVPSSFISFSFDQTAAIDEGATEVLEVPVFASEASDMDRTIGLYVDASSTMASSQYNVPSSVTIPAGSLQGVVEVVVTNSPNLGFGGATIVLGMTAEAGIDQPTSSTGSAEAGTLSVSTNLLTITAKTLCLDNELSISITLDAYPEETYWYLKDGGGNIIADPGPYALYANPYSGMSGTVELGFCLSSGAYSFEIYDDYGDGGGPIAITGPGGVVLWTTDGVYGNFTSGSFTL